jgi:glycosyltransferase involved in cell wall biosynthesis
MNILHINSFSLKSKKTFPHIVIHNKMVKSGINSQIISFSGDYEETNVRYLRKQSKTNINISRYLRKIFFSKDNSYYFYPEWNLDNVSLKQIENKLVFKPDLIIVYWSDFFFNIKIIYLLALKYRSVVFFYTIDMAHLTGGCHYSNGCENYSLACGNCPALHVSHSNDISARTFKLKKYYLDKMDLGLIIPSFELMAQSSKSLLWKGKQIKKILLSVDEDIFFPTDNKELIRSKYNLSKTDKVLLFAASRIDDPRKGFNELHSTLLNLIRNTNGLFDSVTLLILGSNLPHINPRIKYLHLDYTNDVNVLAEVMRISDYYVNTSMEDSGPLLLNQAVMSGLPIVSFKTGVAIDLVEEGHNGFLASEKNSSSLFVALEKMFQVDYKSLKEMSNRSRNIGLERLTVNQQINGILAFYSELKLIE